MNRKPTVLIGEDVGEGNIARLRAAFPQVDFHLCYQRSDLIAAAPEADVIFTKALPAEAIAAAGHLQWVQAGTAGVEGMLGAGLRDRDVLLTNARGAHGIPISELVLAMMLAFASGLHTLIRAQRGRDPVVAEVLSAKFELEGQTICVVGLGDIGGTLARKARALGLRVLGVRRSAAAFPGVDELFAPDRLAEAMARADHVAICLPASPATRAIVGESELRAMKPSAYLYNVGRGSTADPDALVRALREGWIAGAGLDVSVPDPPSPDSPLWDMPNVILSQHTSGDSPHNADRITAIFADNLGRYLRSEPLENVVDKGRGY